MHFLLAVSWSQLAGPECQKQRRKANECPNQPFIRGSCFWKAKGKGGCLVLYHETHIISLLKPTVCPSCRKPLPRCALCLMHMGTPIDPLRKAIAANDSRKGR